MAYKFEIYKDKTGQFRVRFKYSGEVIFSTEAYTAKASAQKAIKSIKEKGPDAPVEDLTAAAKAPAPKAAAKAPATKAGAKAPADTPAKVVAKALKKASAKPAAVAKAAVDAVGSAVASTTKAPATKPKKKA